MNVLSPPDEAPVAGDTELTVRRLAALAHPARLAILRELACRDACCVKDMVARVGLAQSTVSQHIKVLVDAGLVAYRANRQASAYSLDRSAIGVLAEDVAGLLDACCNPNCSKKPR